MALKYSNISTEILILLSYQQRSWANMSLCLLPVVDSAQASFCESIMYQTLNAGLDKEERRHASFAQIMTQRISTKIFLFFFLKLRRFFLLFEVSYYNNRIAILLVKAKTDKKELATKRVRG